jgi:hypothetical protein
MARVACTHIRASGRRCRGHIIRVEAAKADLSWRRRADGTAWSFDVGQPKSFRLHCSGSHEALKVAYSELPVALQEIAGLRDVVIYPEAA